MARIPSELELDLISRDLSWIQPEMMKCDADKCWAANKYIKIPELLSVRSNNYLLVETLNYRMVWFEDRRLGIALKGDPRFDEDGQYLVDKPYC